MKYMGDSEWWNERFKVRELNLMLHEKCLEDDIKFFCRAGKILDIACGDGRNAIFLARLGYHILAIDFSDEALSRLDYFAKKENLKIETKLVDLSTDNIFTNLDKFDGVIINHYRLKPQLYSDLMNHIEEGGILWVNGFRDIPNDNPNITAPDILIESDFMSLEEYKLENKKLYEVGQRHFVRYIWRK
ncbi:MAG: class I SAM-dependent methyltransferase [Romboutsia sp.]|uniref:class I SAM-dependent methyltransferase n=1 Tax=Romboutsia sp. TaxID=1965302 RepID=UPI003F3CF135